MALRGIGSERAHHSTAANRRHRPAGKRKVLRQWDPFRRPLDSSLLQCAPFRFPNLDHLARLVPTQAAPAGLAADRADVSEIFPRCCCYATWRSRSLRRWRLLASARSLPFHGSVRLHHKRLTMQCAKTKLLSSTNSRHPIHRQGLSDGRRGEGTGSQRTTYPEAGAGSSGSRLLPLRFSTSTGRY
jgi:hypothetical protein